MFGLHPSTTSTRRGLSLTTRSVVSDVTFGLSPVAILFTCKILEADEDWKAYSVDIGTEKRVEPQPSRKGQHSGNGFCPTDFPGPYCSASMIATRSFTTFTASMSHLESEPWSKRMSRVLSAMLPMTAWFPKRPSSTRKPAVSPSCSNKAKPSRN